MEKNILVIHGFNSKPGQKSKKLKEEFPKFNIITPQLNKDPIKAVSQLKQVINSLKNETHIVGTSLGGFYSMYLSSQFRNRDDLYYYYINPSWDPFITLFNLKVKSFLDEFNIEEKKHYSLKLRKIKSDIIGFGSATPPILNNSTFFFGKNDQVLDFKKLKQYIYSFNKPVDIVNTNENHRHQDIAEIISKIKHNLEIRI